MKKILIMYKAWAGYLPRFADVGGKMGVKVVLGHFTDLELKVENGKVSLKIGEANVKSFDLIYVRSVGLYHEEMAILAEYCKTHRVKLVDRSLEEGNVDRDHKSFEAMKLLEAGLSYPESYFGNKARILKYCDKVKKWPVVIKDTGGRRGRGVYLVKNYQTVEKIFKGRVKRNYVVQEYIPNDGEYRVWVVGGKLVGAMHRPVRMGEFEMVGITGKSKRVDLDGAMERLAIRAAQVMKIDMAGLDMVKDKRSNEAYVLEVNRSAVFGTFERVTKIDVVREIMAWLVGQMY